MEVFFAKPRHCETKALKYSLQNLVISSEHSESRGIDMPMFCRERSAIKKKLFDDETKS